MPSLMNFGVGLVRTSFHNLLELEKVLVIGDLVKNSLNWRRPSNLEVVE
jgi:hypothetical protein